MKHFYYITILSYEDYDYRKFIGHHNTLCVDPRSMEIFDDWDKAYKIKAELLHELGEDYYCEIETV